MGQSYETAGRSERADLSAKQPHELLIQLGGALTVLLAVATTAIQWWQGAIVGNELSVVTVLMINAVLGGALFVASAITRKNLMNGAIVAGVVSVILLIYGGTPGQIGGAVGILGAVLGAASPYLPWSRKK
jgi:hypothetical protein